MKYMIQYTNYTGLTSINIYELHRFNLRPYVIHHVPKPDIDRNNVTKSLYNELLFCRRKTPQEEEESEDVDNGDSDSEDGVVDSD